MRAEVANAEHAAAEQCCSTRSTSTSQAGIIDAGIRYNFDVSIQSSQNHLDCRRDSGNDLFHSRDSGSEVLPAASKPCVFHDKRPYETLLLRKQTSAS